MQHFAVFIDMKIMQFGYNYVKSFLDDCSVKETMLQQKIQLHKEYKESSLPPA